MPRLSAGKQKPARRAAFEVDALIAALVRERSEPMSAYDVLDILARRGERLAPQQVYRSLGRLRSEGHVRRIESLNAFCAGREDGHAILYCELCGEYQDLPVSHFVEQFRELAQSAGYTLSRSVIELCGVCQTCASASPNEVDRR